MILRFLCAAALVTLFAGIPARAQDEITRRQRELQELREQIRILEEKSRVQQKNENETLELLDTYDNKAALLQRLLKKLQGAEHSLQGRIADSRSAFDRLERQLSFLKQHYSRYVVSVYKGGRVQDLELLFSSGSLNQFAIRNEYLQRFTDQRKRDAERILQKRQELEETQARLERELSEERRLIAEKGAEEDRFVTLAANRRATLQRIRKDRTLIGRQLQRQIDAARDMEKLIEQLIQSDRIRREQVAAAESRLPRLPKPAAIGGGFEKKRGRLRWPVESGTIVARFGPHQHPTLKTITQNTGIDIAVEQGSNVQSVAAGEVALISWLPSYGNLVILNHNDGYRTVYTHLANIRIAEGDAVQEGELIGTSGDSVDGPRLHFEVWKDREKQNPESWLSRQ